MGICIEIGSDNQRGTADDWRITSKGKNASLDMDMIDDINLRPPNSNPGGQARLILALAVSSCLYHSVVSLRMTMLQKYANSGEIEWCNFHLENEVNRSKELPHLLED